MNYKAKISARKELLGHFRSNFPEGCIKLTNETKEHFRVKCEVAHWFKKQGYDVWSECVFKTTDRRPDLLALHSGGRCVAIEVLHSESEKKRATKKALPDGIEELDVLTSNWDYEAFEF